MALSDIRFAPLPAQQPLVNPQTGAPTSFFVDWLTDLANRLVSGINNLNNAVNALQVAQQQSIAASQAQVAQAQTVAVAQATADVAGGTGAQSGDAQLTVTVVAGGAWSAGPQVDLAGVAAGTLSAVNSSPNQLSNTDVLNPGSYVGNYRIVEIVGAVETVIFNGTFSAEKTQEDIGFITLLFNLTDTSTFTVGRASTGAVSYRLDANSPNVEVQNLGLYLYVRRS